MPLKSSLADVLLWGILLFLSLLLQQLDLLLSSCWKNC